jgi:hypothetical protein
MPPQTNVSNNNKQARAGLVATSVPTPGMMAVPEPEPERINVFNKYLLQNINLQPLTTTPYLNNLFINTPPQRLPLQRLPHQQCI